MTKLSTNPPSRHESERRVETDPIMRLMGFRFHNIVRHSIQSAHNSVDGQRDAQRKADARAAAEKLAYEDKIRRDELETTYKMEAAEPPYEREVAELKSIPNQPDFIGETEANPPVIPELDEQQKFLEMARNLTNSALNNGPNSRRD